MPVTSIPQEHHVVRHCRKRVTIRKDGAVVGIAPEAFNLRPANPPQRPDPEKYLSAVYFEYFNENLNRFSECCAALQFLAKPSDVLARVNVGKVKEIFDGQKVAVRVTHEGGGRHHNAYAAIRPQLMNDLLAAKMASEAVVEFKEVKDL